MTDLIIASFTQESHAIEASNKLFELESIGEISIYELVIVKKDKHGNTEVMICETARVFEIFRGTLGGPVGMMVHIFSDTHNGVSMQSDYFTLAEDFRPKGIQRLQPGSVAIVAEIDENNTVFVDESLEAMGGIISRSEVFYENERYSEDQIESIDEEIASERAKIKIAVIQENERIQKKIAILKERRKEKITQLQTEARRKIGNGKARSLSMEEEIKKSYNYTILRLLRRIEKHQALIDELRNEIKRIEGRI